MAVISPERFIKASEVKDQWGLNLLIYGPPGAGKTVLAASAQDSKYGKDVLFLDVESGTRSLSDRPDITIFVIKEWADFRHIYEWIITEDHTYKTIVIDSLSEAQSLSLQHVLRSAGRPDGPAGIQDYGKSKQQVVSMMRAFKGLSASKGYTIIFTALETTEKDEISGAIMRYPALSPATQRAAMAIVDGVGYLAVGTKGKRILHLAQTHSIAAKIRQPVNKPVISTKIESPSLATILEQLNAK